MTKIKIQIKNRWTCSILFEYEKEDNTINDTLIEAVKNKANLGGADLGGAYLGGADLRGAYLRGAYLGGADLRGAYLRGANLRGADLRGAYLRGAYLGGADLGGAYLGGADLRGAYLRGANLRGANLGGAKEFPYIPLACPSDGAFIGWKKVQNRLIELEIPSNAKRLSATGNKCRCDKARVISILNLSTGEKEDAITNCQYAPFVTYKVGEMVYPDSFDENRWNECSHGIHFFINKQDAINY